MAPPERPQAWDVEIKMEDTAMKNRMAAMLQTSKETAQTLHKLDEEVSFAMAV
jgi:SWI/SNF-related matrix-associated actin-dependent regulator of chromatin subfamily D